MHHPDRPYADQDLVHLCCLVDRGRPFTVDTELSRLEAKLTLQVQSYEIPKGSNLDRNYSKTKSKVPPVKRMYFRVFGSWLQPYLEWFDHDLWNYIKVQTYGMTVQRLPGRMAADDKESYEQQGVSCQDKFLVPLPKTHKVVSTLQNFGVTSEGGDFQPYCTDLMHLPPTKHPKYNAKLTSSCHPKGYDFEYVPVARANGTVPAHHLQIRAIRADIKRKKNMDVIRWLGLQGNKYVSLPTEWVNLNFDITLREEAIKRAEGTNKEERRYVRVPPGDSRDDDPPLSIRDIAKGSNFYYQGANDNCLVGGLANAVFWMSGCEVANKLLEKNLPINIDCWSLFVKHVHVCLPGHLMKKVTCNDVLQLDDTLPVIVQLRSRDMAESHAICIFQGCIYDSASRYVLTKCPATITWCSGAYAFDRHLHLYQLQKKVTTKPKKKRSRYK
jgi:hypothetical protein